MTRIPKLLAAAIVSSLAMTGIASTTLPATGQTPDTAPKQHRANAHHLAYRAQDGNRELVVVRNLATGAEWTAYRGASTPQAVELANNGKWVAWLYYGGEPIPSNRIMIRKHGGDAQNVLRDYPRKFSFIDSASFSPNGKQLAFIAHTKNSARNLYTVKRNGSGLHLLRRNVSGCGDNCGRTIWSPKGDHIAYFSEQDVAPFGFRWNDYHVKSGRVTKLPDDFFGWSANQRWIGVSRDVNDRQRVIRMRPNGSHQERIATLSISCGGAIDWGTDNRIALDAQGIYLLNANTGASSPVGDLFCTDLSYS